MLRCPYPRIFNPRQFYFLFSAACLFAFPLASCHSSDNVTQKSNKEAGSALATVDLRSLAAPEILISQLPEAGKYEVILRDEGPGIDPYASSILAVHKETFESYPLESTCTGTKKHFVCPVDLPKNHELLVTTVNKAGRKQTASTTNHRRLTEKILAKRIEALPSPQKMQARSPQRSPTQMPSSNSIGFDLHIVHVYDYDIPGDPVGYTLLKKIRKTLIALDTSSRIWDVAMTTGEYPALDLPRRPAKIVLHVGPDVDIPVPLPLDHLIEYEILPIALTYGQPFYDDPIRGLQYVETDRSEHFKQNVLVMPPTAYVPGYIANYIHAPQTSSTNYFESVKATNRINIVVVDHFVSNNLLGAAWPRSGILYLIFDYNFYAENGTSVFTHATYSSTVAHELGHLFGLGHATAGNLMATSAANGGFVLEPIQAARVFSMFHTEGMQPASAGSIYIRPSADSDDYQRCGDGYLQRIPTGPNGQGVEQCESNFYSYSSPDDLPFREIELVPEFTTGTEIAEMCVLWKKNDGELVIPPVATSWMFNPDVDEFSPVRQFMDEDAPYGGEKPGTCNFNCKCQVLVINPEAGQGEWTDIEDPVLSTGNDNGGLDIDPDQPPGDGGDPDTNPCRAIINQVPETFLLFRECVSKAGQSCSTGTCSFAGTHCGCH